MNADDVLIEDHDNLRDLLNRLKSTTTDDGEMRTALLDMLVAVLTVHVQIEDELFYPAIAEVSPLLGASHAQHRQIDDQLAVVLRTDPTTDAFDVELDMLAATLHHHAGEEEELMFAQSQALGNVRLASLGERMERRRNQLNNSRRNAIRIRMKLETLRRLA
jgi:hemerythrin HHE cation binding domain-containing protein